MKKKMIFDSFFINKFQKYRTTAPMYRAHRTHVPYPWTVPTVPTLRTQLATDLAADFLNIFFEVY